MIAGDENDYDLYLQTSPEFPMKRLLAAGSGAIYQICKVFRKGEQGRLHNPEFTMLEWYRPGYDHHRLMDEVMELLEFVLKGFVNLRKPQRESYSGLFQRYVNVDVFSDDISVIQSRIHELGLEPPLGLNDDDMDAWRDFLLTHIIEPCLPEGLLFVVDYPASQAALARLRADNRQLAERFELYWNGVELANGFHELTDHREQRQRIEHDLQVRQQRELPQVPVDQRFLAALDAGLPDCAGVALGIDRLIMMAAGETDIDAVIPFPVDRA